MFFCFGKLERMNIMNKKINVDKLYYDNRCCYTSHDKDIEHLFGLTTEDKLKVLSIIKAVAKAKLSEKTVHVEAFNIVMIVFALIFGLYFAVNIESSVVNIIITIAILILLVGGGFLGTNALLKNFKGISDYEIIIEICEKKTREIESKCKPNEGGK